MANINGYLENIKSAASGETVRDSIISCLRTINSDNPTTIKPLNVTANGTYTSQTGFAYNPVTVNVPTGGSSNYTFEELEVTENGEYEPEEENTMYSKVTVDVPQFAKDIMPDVFTITQNGEYDPVKDGYDGYGKLIINVNESTSEGPFTVIFYDSDMTTPLQTSQVEKNGNAIFNPTKGYPTPPVGQVFCGWNPNPTGVTRDLKCYPNFQQKSVVIDEISDDWTTICAKNGIGYPLGSRKALSYSALIPKEELQAVLSGFSYPRDMQVTFDGIAVKVYEGEGGTNSTWIWQGFTLNGNMFGGENIYEVNRHYMCYPGSQMSIFLNNCFFNHMADIFKAAIKPVIKYTQASLANHAPYNVVPEAEYVWIPSVKEMMGTGTEGVFGDIIAPYGDQSVFETAYDKLYTQVPQSIAYFRDILEMTSVERDQLLLRDTTYETPLRDNSGSWSWEDETYIRPGASDIINARNQTGCFIGAEYVQVKACLGFCM